MIEKAGNYKIFLYFRQSRLRLRSRLHVHQRFGSRLLRIFHSTESLRNTWKECHSRKVAWKSNGKSKRKFQKFPRFQNKNFYTQNFMWNTITVQYNPLIEEEFDEHFKVTCEYGYDFWKTVTFPFLDVEYGFPFLCAVRTERKRKFPFRISPKQSRYR